MDVSRAILERYSTRDFKPDPVPKEVLEKILATSLQAPSSGNGQPWEIFAAAGTAAEDIRRSFLERFAADVPGKPEMSGLPPSQQPQALQERMKKITGDRLKLLGIDPQDNAAMKSYREIGGRLFRAPVILILCMDKALNTWSVLDIGLIAQTIMLAARESGVASIIAGAFVAYPDILRKELDIPDTLQIVSGIGLGYENPTSIINTYRSPRRPLQEVVRFKGLQG